jgi:hypothetical protein
LTSLILPRKAGIAGEFRSFERRRKPDIYGFRKVIHRGFGQGFTLGLPAPDGGRAWV